MFVAFAFLGCLFSYRTSKYYPDKLIFLQRSSMAIGNTGLYLTGLAFLIMSAILSIVEYGLGTGLFTFFATIIVSLCLLMITLPLNKKWIYLLAGLFLLLMVLENIF